MKGALSWTLCSGDNFFKGSWFVLSSAFMWWRGSTWTNNEKNEEVLGLLVICFAGKMYICGRSAECSAAGRSFLKSDYLLQDSATRLWDKAEIPWRSPRWSKMQSNLIILAFFRAFWGRRLEFGNNPYAGDYLVKFIWYSEFSEQNMHRSVGRGLCSIRFRGFRVF